jgi:hypothetical protein
MKAAICSLLLIAGISAEAMDEGPISVWWHDQDKTTIVAQTTHHKGEAGSYKIVDASLIKYVKDGRYSAFTRESGVIRDGAIAALVVRMKAAIEKFESGK